MHLAGHEAGCRFSHFKIEIQSKCKISDYSVLNYSQNIKIFLFGCCMFKDVLPLAWNRLKLIPAKYHRAKMEKNNGHRLAIL